MRLAIVATPPLALMAIVTAGLALRPHHAPPADEPPVVASRYAYAFDAVEGHRPRLTCEEAHSLILRGTTTGGSHLRIAGPVLFTDLTTDPQGFFFQRIPVEGDVCDLLEQSAHYSFSDGSMHVRYSIELAR